MAAIDAAQTITEVDDIYRPFRPHRKTRASVAREKGLSPLAELIMQQEDKYEPTLEEAAAEYISEDRTARLKELKETYRVERVFLFPGRVVFTEGKREELSKKSEVRRLELEEREINNRAVFV